MTGLGALCYPAEAARMHNRSAGSRRDGTWSQLILSGQHKKRSQAWASGFNVTFKKWTGQWKHWDTALGREADAFLALEDKSVSFSTAWFFYERQTANTRVSNSRTPAVNHSIINKNMKLQHFHRDGKQKWTENGPLWAPDRDLAMQCTGGKWLIVSFHRGNKLNFKQLLPHDKLVRCIERLLLWFSESFISFSNVRTPRWSNVLSWRHY